MIYEKLAAYYDQFIDNELNNLYFELIKEHFKKGNVIDLGCGTAPLAIILAKNKFNVSAIDISSSMLERAYNNSINEDVKINFYVHNILDPLNIEYDIITMSSDVINYIDSEEKVEKVFLNISKVMNLDSIFIFDFLKVKYLEELLGYHEEIAVDDSIIIWDVLKTNKTAQVKHKITIGDVDETHIQTTFEERIYVNLLNENNLKVIKTVSLEDRMIFVCKRKKRKQSK